MEITVEGLREAARNGDVEFLRKCVDANKPNHFYLTVSECGNMLFFAASKKQEVWIREAIKLLPVELIQQLLCQPVFYEQNPLHEAAIVGNVRIVKMFLKAFDMKQEEKKKDDASSSLPPPAHHVPWLMTELNGNTPCHFALKFHNQECGLEIWRMDKESLSNMDNNIGWSLLGLALYSGHDKVAMEILSSTHSFSTSAGKSGNKALHLLPQCSSSSERKNICRLLLKKMSELILQKSNHGLSVFHTWAKVGKIWPFECLLESNDIIPNVRKVFVELISTTNVDGENPLHILAKDSSRSNKEGAQIGKLLIDIFRKEANTPTGELQYPWLAQAHDNKKTPLDYAMDAGNEEFTHMILSEDKNVLKTCLTDNVLFVAIEKRFHEVPLKILEIVDEEEDLMHLLTNDQKLNALHVAPQCTRAFCERLIKHYPSLIEGVDKEGETILHKWVKIGQVWPFECLLNNSEIKENDSITFHLMRKDNNGNNPFHVAATCTNESTLQIVKLLLEFEPHFKNCPDPYVLPWCAKNKVDEGALHVAIRCQLDQQLALYLLSLQPTMDNYIALWLNYYSPKEHLILFLAMEKNFFEVVKRFLTKVNKASCSKYLQDSSTGINILHLASTCTDAEFVQWLVGEVPSELITTPDKDGMSPLSKACEVGAARIVKSMLEKDPWRTFKKEPLAWVKACEKGNSSVMQVFVDCCPEKFSDHCRVHHDTPLHHIKLRNLTRYEDFLKIQYMKDLINVQNSDQATPLHKAIENRNILLAEALLNMDKIRYNIKDVHETTAKDLLAQVCKEDQRWNEMCKNIGFDPNIRTSYFERKTNLLEVRNTLSVVAALLATITFTAGFTLPGGLDQETGKAMMVNKAVFAVFLLSDTLSMCFSMVVLISLIWSMVLEPNQSLYMIDRSVGLLRLALYLTLVAFASGVYIVMSSKLLWAAILVIVFCSLVGVSGNRQLLYNVFTLGDRFFSFLNKKRIDPINRMEQGLPQPRRGETSNQNPTLHLLGTEESEDLG